MNPSVAARGQDEVQAMLCEVRINMSRRMPPGQSEIDLGRYTLTAITSASPPPFEFLLKFDLSAGDHSNPEEEAAIVGDFLSVLCATRVARSSARIDNVDIPSQGVGSPIPANLVGDLPAESFRSAFDAVMALDDSVVRSFLRACRLYRLATDFIPEDPTLAFFLLSTSIECLSNLEAVVPENDVREQLEEGQEPGKAERFCFFLLRFSGDALSLPDEAPIAAKDLLKEVYYSHRSAFVHGGREVSSAALMADRVGSAYFKHSDDGREIYTPGLAWFEKVVRVALCRSLESLQSTGQVDQALLARLATEKSVLQIKAKRDLAQGQVVTFDDIEFQ